MTSNPLNRKSFASPVSTRSKSMLLSVLVMTLTVSPGNKETPSLMPVGFSLKKRWLQPLEPRWTSGLRLGRKVWRWRKS
ncbi:protein of unknown function [Cyanobium sp. NIES-981]|nr:protein of unknown function [Cyanobium sp. NIES-981]